MPFASYSSGPHGRGGRHRIRRASVAAPSASLLFLAHFLGSRNSAFSKKKFRFKSKKNGYRKMKGTCLLYE